MLRRPRDPTPFGRVVRPRLDPNRRLLWQFDVAHIRGGPGDHLPIEITARPILVQRVSQAEYILELVVVFVAATEILVNRYARRVHRRILTREQIGNIPLFIFPIDVLFL